MSARLLVVEDRDTLRRMLERALSQEGYAVETAGDGAAAVRRLEEGEAFDLVLTDLKLPGASGLDVLTASRAALPATPVVVMTAYGTIGAAVEAMKRGAADFLEKPVEIDDLFALLRSLLGGGADSFHFAPAGGPAIVGRHPRMRAALRLLERVAETDSTVLLTGESGTGKEVFARALHAVSKRRAGPFVAVNCAALPEPLLENELFGHEKGAYTGAHRRQSGRFEQANGGTLLLDEIGELGHGVQSKVLRVLEERAFERVGGERTLHADVRLVAATNRDLATMVASGAFREDLYYRLEVFPIHLPPLRERRSDVPLLARHLLAELAARHGRTAPRLSAEAERLLSEASWPGNVRQLSNLLERAMILESGAALGVVQLEPLLSGLGDERERERVRGALVEAGGDKQQAAKLLGVSYRKLLRQVRQWDLEGVPRYRDG